MTDYSELVKALRCKRDDCEGCDLSFFDKDEGWMCQYAANDDDAADAIEALEADNKEMLHELEEAAKQIRELQAEVDILKVSGREAYFEGLAAQPHWVSVEERYPDKAGRYLVYGDTYFTPDHNGDVDHYKNIEIGYWNDYAPKIVGNTMITHWMPLPQPPREVLDGQ